MLSQNLPVQLQLQPTVTYPNIAEWLCYCDKHPQRYGDNLSAYIAKFEEQGYRHIDQITWATIEQLSDWLKIVKGIVDLMITYTREDMRLLGEGKFLMGMEVGNEAGGHNGSESMI
jgi:hypothetical protein